ncbi:tail tubular protein A [Synechococcus phage S-SRP02]|nr:tail tubular protein A [Synechococcus phage S-SRP02]
MGLANQGVTPGRTTLLEAVNICLQNIGEQPVNSLENQQIVEATMAERTILEFHKEGQTRGWSWNTEYGYEFTKDNATNKIVVPANVVSWATDAYEWAGRFQLRGQTVYDREKRTSILGSDITTLNADVVWLLPWDECPEVFNRWITIRSARVFSDRVLSSDSIFKYTSVDEQAALVELQRVELEQAQANSLTGGPGLRPFPTYSPGLGLLGRNRGYMRG